MLKVLKLEYLKMAKYMPFTILLSVYFLILLLVGFFSSQFSVDVQGQEITLEKLGAYNFPAFWQLASWFALVLKLFLGVLIIFNVTNEFSFNTIKQNLIDGLSKAEFFASKVLGSFLFALLSTIVLGIIVIIMGSIFSKSDDPFYKGIEFLGYYGLNLIVFFSILVFLSFLVKRSVIAILITIVWWIVENIINGIEKSILLAPEIKKQTEANNGEKIVIDESHVESLFLYSDYLPLNVLSNLVKLPKGNFINYFQNKPIFSINPTDYSFVIAAIIYLVIFLWLGYWIFKKRDL